MSKTQKKAPAPAKKAPAMPMKKMPAKMPMKGKK